MSPSSIDYFSALYQLINGNRADGERLLAAERDADISPYFLSDEVIEILDLANGRLCPQYILLNTRGQLVIGIDIENRTQPGWEELGYRLARWLYGLRFRANFDEPKRLICGDVTNLPIKKCCFDLVTSIAAFEHFLNVPAVVGEILQVLKPGGIAYIRIHPFTSLSGGHNVKLMEIPLHTLPVGVDAWDHLRKRRLPIRVPLNEWRLSQYLDVFSQHFEIVKHYCAMREGEHLLTPEIEAELSGYTRDELTCGAYVIVARKPD